MEYALRETGRGLMKCESTDIGDKAFDAVLSMGQAMSVNVKAMSKRMVSLHP